MYIMEIYKEQQLLDGLSGRGIDFGYCVGVAPIQSWPAANVR
jgi:hypothetical protein